MARTAVALSSLVKNAGTAITEVSLATCTTSGAAIAAHTKDEKLAIYVENTAATSATITVKASDFGIALGQGDLAITAAQNTPQLIVLEGQRFLQSDGTINIDCSTAATGVIGAIQLP